MKSHLASRPLLFSLSCQASSRGPSVRCAPCDLLSSHLCGTLNHGGPSLVTCLRCAATESPKVFFFPGLASLDAPLCGSPRAQLHASFFRKEASNCINRFPPFLSGQVFLMITFNQQPHLQKPWRREVTTKPYTPPCDTGIQIIWYLGNTRLYFLQRVKDRNHAVISLLNMELEPGVG